MKHVRDESRGSGRAVFISYASEDSDTSQRISDALRAAGIVTWLDHDELRGGDAWDASIRKQIHECALFIAVISGSTQSRDEGYFRREWHLAIERMLDMAEDRPFLVPVVIDATPEGEARVPARFRERQWVSLPGGQPNADFVARIARLLEEPSRASAGSSERAAPGHRDRGSSGRPAKKDGRWAVAVAVGAIVLASVGGGWWWSRRDVADHAVAADRKAIAVLPFASMSEDKSNAQFADGMQEDLLTQLAQLGELRVVSRTSVAEYRNTRKNLRQVGAELGVGSVVEGSVRSAGGRVRVSVQLIDARTDRHLWAQSYDRKLEDIFAIQSELATEIASALKVSLTPREEVRLARRPTENLQAYGLLRRYEQLWSAQITGNDLSAGQMDKIALLSRAVELDPGFAIAWALLAEEHARARFWHLDLSEGRLEKARDALDRALAIAPDDITVRTLAGSVYYYGYRDFERAAQYFEDLLRVVPHHVETLNRLAYVRRRQGRFPEAIALHERALAVDARNLEALGALADNFTAFRDFDRASAVHRRVLEIRPGDFNAQAALHELEFMKSGSFAGYDNWRASLPAGAERASRVLFMDARRAWSRRDFDAASRIADTIPRDPAILDYEGLPHALLGKGERAKALEVARALVREDTKALGRPQDPKRLIRIAFAKAILGDREAAHTRFREAWAIIYVRKDVLDGDELLAKWSYVHALLGEREETLRLLRELARRPGFANAPQFWRTNPFYLKLWDDPQFQALVNDPATNAPLPIADREPPPLALP